MKIKTLRIMVNYGAENEIIYNTGVLKSNICDYSNAYILVIGDITIIGRQATQVAFKSFVPFTRCIIKIDEATIDDADNLELVMPNL